MRKEVITCDICGVDKEDLGRHWTATVDYIDLKFKHVANIQHDVVIQDVCYICSGKIHQAILDTIREIKES